VTHADAAFTVRVYSHTMRRREEERERLKHSCRGTFGQRIRAETHVRAKPPTALLTREKQKPAPEQGFRKSGRPD
jgi:hypothetical protein